MTNVIIKLPIFVADFDVVDGKGDDVEVIIGNVVDAMVFVVDFRVVRIGVVVGFGVDNVVVGVGVVDVVVVGAGVVDVIVVGAVVTVFVVGAGVEVQNGLAES